VCQDLEGNGVATLATLLGDDAALLVALDDEAKTLKATEAPVEETTGRPCCALWLRAEVLLVAIHDGESSCADTRAEVHTAEHCGAPDQVPVGVLWGALATVAGLHELSATWHEDLALLLEVVSDGLDELVCLHVANGGTLSLANVADAAASSVWLYHLSQVWQSSKYRQQQ